MTAQALNKNAFEARAQQDGILDADGFFTQSDWEFELDMIPKNSREALQAHLDKAPQDHDTAMFLKGYLMDTGTHFTAFNDVSND